MCSYKPCSRVYTAFRSTARYCSDQCRTSDWHRARPRETLRDKVLARGLTNCTQCGKEFLPGKRTYVRADPDSPKDPQKAEHLCGKCHSNRNQSEAARKRREKYLARLEAVARGETVS